MVGNVEGWLKDQKCGKEISPYRLTYHLSPRKYDHNSVFGEIKLHQTRQV